MDEFSLINATQRGDVEAFNHLVLTYQDVVYTQAYRVLGEHQAADDATQEAFISAYRGIHSYRGGSFKAWLLRIVTNACYDELRRRQRRPTSPLEPINSDDEEIESGPWMADPGGTPECYLEQIELSDAIQKCLEKLPLDFRSVVLLVDVQGLDYQETSTIIRKPVGTVKSRLSRARVRMKDCLRGFGELLPRQFRLVDEKTT
jgi:RNA polymerase sigma-70 factor (ECF subfamily)